MQTDDAAPRLKPDSLHYDTILCIGVYMSVVMTEAAPQASDVPDTTATAAASSAPALTASTASTTAAVPAAAAAPSSAAAAAVTSNAPDSAPELSAESLAITVPAVTAETVTAGVHLAYGSRKVFQFAHETVSAMAPTAPSTCLHLFLSCALGEKDTKHS